MNELNSDWVLFASLGVVVLSSLFFAIWGWKAFRSMDDKKD